MIPDDALLSAYMDGEVTIQLREEIQRAIQSNPDVRRRYDMLTNLKLLLHDDSVDYDGGMDRVLDAVNTRIRQPRTLLWKREVRLPLPALIGAAALLVAMLGFAIYSFVPRVPQNAADYLSRADNVDVTFRLDGAEMEHVLQWLVEKNMLGEVKIEIPEAEQFEFIGEPVFLKSGESPEGPVR